MAPSKARSSVSRSERSFCAGKPWVAPAGHAAGWSGPRATAVDRSLGQTPDLALMPAHLASCVAVGILLAGAAACQSSQTAASGTSPAVSASAAPSAPGSSQLDPQVPMPSGFPSDVPVYPGSRLTAGAAFSSSGESTWGMEWETLDSVDKVQAFYKSKFSQGDWTISFSGTANGSFSAVFARKSNSKYGGLVGAGSANGVTTITLSLVNAS